MNNFTEVGNGFYLVRSPEGFDKAIEHYDDRPNPGFKNRTSTTIKPNTRSSF